MSVANFHLDFRPLGKIKSNASSDNIRLNQRRKITHILQQMEENRACVPSPETWKLTNGSWKHLWFHVNVAGVVGPLCGGIPSELLGRLAVTRLSNPLPPNRE